MKKTRSKKRKAWEQLPGEQIKAYKAAQKYFEFGPSRSLDKVADEVHKSLGLIKRWSARHHWKSRAAAHDRWGDQIQQQKDEDQLRQSAQLWAERKEKRREDDYQIAVKMREKALELLKYPIAKCTTSVDGKSPTIVNPAGWNLATVARLAESASDLSDKAIRNDSACHNVVEEVDVFDNIVPYKSQK